MLYSRSNLGKSPISPSEEDKNKNESKEKKKDEKKEEKKNDVVAAKLKNDNPPRLFLAYVAQVVVRMIIEIVFLVIQMRIYVFKFVVPELFKCGRWPCPNVVDCFISRPMEKTFLIWIMFTTAIIMIGLCILDLHHIGFGNIYAAWEGRRNDITKQYKSVTNNVPVFAPVYGRRRLYRGYPEAVGIPSLLAYPARTQTYSSSLDTSVYDEHT
ncbi:gap junction gamma-1 protein-like [Styela clava]